MGVQEKLRERFPGLHVEGFRGGDPNNPKIPRDLPVPMSEAEVVEFEQTLGIRLPEDYRSFLLEIGAAQFFQTCVRPIQVREDFGDIEHFEEMYGSKEEKFYDIWSNRKTYSDRIAEHMTPIGGNGFGNQFCMVFKGPDRGKIFFYEMVGPAVTLVANSFEDFLNRLEPNPY